MSIDDEFGRLEASLARRHPKVHAVLRPGKVFRARFLNRAHRWFAWHDGQEAQPDVTFLATYRFSSHADAFAQLSFIRQAALANPLQGLALLVFARRSLYAWPLLIDGAGDGYCYHLIRRTVFHRFKGERDSFFPSFESFVSFLADLAESEFRNQDDRFEREYELLRGYTGGTG